MFNDKPKERLQQIILLAKAGGFTYGNFLDESNSFSISSFNPETGRIAIVVKKQKSIQVVYDSIYMLFFDTVFAKAVFGDSWPEHLAELAGSSNKLDYILNNINFKTQVA